MRGCGVALRHKAPHSAQSASLIAPFYEHSVVKYLCDICMIFAVVLFLSRMTLFAFDLASSVALKCGYAFVRDVIAALPSIRLYVQAVPRLRVALR